MGLCRGGASAAGAAGRAPARARPRSPIPVCGLNGRAGGCRGIHPPALLGGVVDGYLGHRRGVHLARHARGERHPEPGGRDAAEATNFGLWAGANEHEGRLQPTVTSYDSDAPVAEDGTLTAKFFAVREAIGARGPVRMPAWTPTLPPASVPLVHRAGLLAGLRAVPAPTSTGPRPASFERLGLDAGMVLHSARPRIPAGEHRLVLTDVRDRALVFADGAFLGVAGPGHPELPVRGAGAVVHLEVLVESLGRVNYGPGIGRHKGLIGPVLVNRRIVQGWDSTPIALQEWSTTELTRALAAGPTSEHAGPGSEHAGPGSGQACPGAELAGPASEHADLGSGQAGRVSERAGFAVATVDVEAPADTFLALPGSRRGRVWVNGFLLGRYWDIGPQVTLYCPAPLLRAGRNTVTVLELEQLGATLELRGRPELGPPEEYVEEFG
ncbi:beta-galactosidase [Nonomuraea jabiensis]|uniref:beta-galactosidase n=1 Tax=Nonomuraea jabiensis TaxID=882448 RepID=UPI0036ABA2D5